MVTEDQSVLAYSNIKLLPSWPLNLDYLKLLLIDWLMLHEQL
jgi:hypothetical protein